MIQTDDSFLSQLILHNIRSVENRSVFSEQTIDFEEEIDSTLLKKIFLKPFSNQTTTFEFQHKINLDYNVLFGLAKAIYEEADFTELSIKIAEHLIENSKHPNIKDGDLFIAKFEDIQLNNKHYQGLGIYKFEEKESFIETNVRAKEISIELRKGIGNKKPDKACLIIFTDEPYTLLIIDNNSNETEYWQEDFINHRAKNDFVNNTTNFLTLTKEFITGQIPQEYEVSKADQIDLLNRSVDYFKSNETFDKNDFEQTVFQDKGIIKSFRNFDQNFQEEHELDLSDSFEISSQAVKKQARAFKSVLKLDKNFHIYIHGDRELIEQGTDKDGRKFYKIYYEAET
ncbi:MAG: nucleoid-associated protein [Bacteroidota bacterium]